MVQRRTLNKVLKLSLVLFILGFGNENGPARPFPQHVRYAPNTLRPTNFSQSQQDDHVRAAYDAWKARYLVQAGTDVQGYPLYRVAFGRDLPNAATTVSEGQGFGMVIVATMAGHDPQARELFDGLWHFARAHPSGIDPHLMTFKVKNGVAVGGNDSAFDGDADIAYGLLLADIQWGSAGSIHYHAEALSLIAGIKASTIGPQSRLPLLGDWVSPNGSPFSQYTPRSSDFMTGHFRAFARATGDPTWNSVVTNVQAAVASIQTNLSPTTGLLPDFIVGCESACVAAPPNFLEGGNDGVYAYNATRDPWRLGTDALLNDDPVSRAAVVKMIAWLASTTGGSASLIRPGYLLDGTPLTTSFFTVVFAAPFGVAAMLDPAQQAFLNAIYANVFNRRENYYEDSINLLCLLMMTGNYWDPTRDN